MTNIGIVRKMDSLGRITLPKELRRVFQINKDDQIEILATDEGILLRIPNIEVKRTDKIESEVLFNGEHEYNG